MKFNKKYLLATVPAMALVGLMAASSVSAANPQMGPGGFGGRGMSLGFHHGIGDPDRFVERLTSEASMLGISVDEMKNYWSQGKGVKEIAAEKGITEEQLKTKLQVAAETKVKTELKTLVDKGVITQAQADARLAAMKAMKEKMGTQLQNKMKIKMQKRGAPGQNGTSSAQS